MGSGFAALALALFVAAGFFVFELFDALPFFVAAAPVGAVLGLVLREREFAGRERALRRGAALEVVVGTVAGCEGVDDRSSPFVAGVSSAPTHPHLFRSLHCRR